MNDIGGVAEYSVQDITVQVTASHHSIHGNMCYMSKVVVLLLVLWCTVIPQLVVRAQCAAGSCVCDTSAGRIDLRGLVDQNAPYTFNYRLGSTYAFYYNPCGHGIELQGCDPDGAICQELSLDSYNLGDKCTEKIIQEGNRYTMQYDEGDQGRVSSVDLVCDELADTPLFRFKGEFSDKKYDFELRTKCACPGLCDDGSSLPPLCGEIESQGSGGDIVGAIGITLMVLAIVVILSYFIIGGIIMHKKYEKKGVEIIPQKSFWFALPFLVRDGCVFTFNPLIKLIKNKAGSNSQ